MFKRRGLILVAISVVMAGMAAWLANNWIQGSLEAAGESDNVQVATAAIEIPYGTKIEGRHVKMIEMPKSSVPNGAYLSAEEVEGQVASTQMLRGELLLAPRFASHDSGSTLASLVEKQKRAVTVRVDDVVGVAGFLLPGNFVDVLASRIERKSRRAVTETVLRNIKVLAVDQKARTEESEPVVVRAVTLEVTPKQAEVLVKRKEEGTIQLTLRNPLDTMVAEAKPKPAPKKTTVRRVRWTPRTTTITVIKGTKVDKTKAKT